MLISDLHHFDIFRPFHIPFTSFALHSCTQLDYRTRWDDKFAKLKFSLSSNGTARLTSLTSHVWFANFLIGELWRIFHAFLAFLFSTLWVHPHQINNRTANMKDIFPSHFAMHFREATISNAAKCIFFASLHFCVELSYILCTIVGGWWKMNFFLFIQVCIHFLPFHHSKRTFPILANQYTELQHAKCIWWKLFKVARKVFMVKTQSLGRIFSPLRPSDMDAHRKKSWGNSDKLKKVFFIYIFNSARELFQLLSSLDYPVALSTHNPTGTQRCHFTPSAMCVHLLQFIHLYFFGADWIWSVRFEFFTHSRLTIHRQLASLLFFFGACKKRVQKILVYISKLLVLLWILTIFLALTPTVARPTNIANIRSNIVCDVVFYHLLRASCTFFFCISMQIYFTVQYVSQVSLSEMKAILFHNSLFFFLLLHSGQRVQWCWWCGDGYTVLALVTAEFLFLLLLSSSSPGRCRRRAVGYRFVQCECTLAMFCMCRLQRVLSAS